MQTLSPLIHYKQQNDKRPLITQLLNKPLYRKIYAAHIRSITENYFADSTYLRQAMRLQPIVEPYIKADSNKLYDYEGFKKNLHETVNANKVDIVGLTELMEPRVEYLLNHPIIGKPQPRIDSMSYQYDGEAYTFTVRIKGAKKGWLFYRHGDKGAFAKKRMRDHGKNADAVAGDNIYSLRLPKHEEEREIQYYFVAENDHIAALLPKRASFEYYSTENEKEISID